MRFNPRPAAPVAGIVDVPGLQNALDLLQAAATAATDDELNDAVAAINDVLLGKQDASNAVTDTELTNALAIVNTSLAGKQDASTAATDTELTNAVATINTALSGKVTAPAMTTGHGLVWNGSLWVDSDLATQAELDTEKARITALESSHPVGLLSARPAANTPGIKTYYATDDNGGTLYVTDGANWKRTGSGQLIDSDKRTSDDTATTTLGDVAGVPNIDVPVGDRPWLLTWGCHTATGVTASEQALLHVCDASDNSIVATANGMVQSAGGNTGSFHGVMEMAALGAAKNYKLRRVPSFGTSITLKGSAVAPIYIRAVWL
jgi:hypothetical protein